MEESAATGSLSTGVFHGLDAGNTGHPAITGALVAADPASAATSAVVAAARSFTVTVAVSTAASFPRVP